MFQCIGSDAYCLAALKLTENIFWGVVLVAVLFGIGYWFYKLIKNL